MKKYTLLLLVLLLAWNARAQQPEKNILGVRTGLNVAWMTVSDGSASESSAGRTGFHISVSDQIRLFSRLPLYLETGVNFSSRGGKIQIEEYGSGADPVYEDVSLRPMYLQVPLLVNYHFNIRDKFTIQPFLGVYYGVGIGGKIKSGKDKIDMFGDYSSFMRSDFGVRMGVGFVWRRIYFGLNGDLGCLNILKKGALMVDGGFQDTVDDTRVRLTNDSFSISIGYNF